MRASANRTQDNESRAVANNVSCKREERQAVHLVDNSPHTKRIAQFQAMMDKSMNPHQVQLRKFREMIDNSPQRKKIVLPGVTQKKGPLDEDELQFKSKEAVQKKGPLDEDELQFKKDEIVQCKGPLDEEELQFKSKETVQKKGPLDEEELQFKKDETVQCKGPLDEEELQFKAEEPVRKQENKTGLPDDLKAGVENLSGMAMDDVRVHYNSGKPAQLNAYAYTQGTEIHVAPGQEKHLPHEAWHVVQQKQGRVQPTMQMAGGVAVNDDKGLEKEADGMGGRAVQCKATGPIQMYATWGINESARNHYHDEWGQTYGITSDKQLKEKISDHEQKENWPAGQREIILGTFSPVTQTGYQLAGQVCNIVFENQYNRNRDGHTYVWHCGPN